ncbi:MAG: DUF4276 family protein [Desulfobacterium sp.]
MSNYIEVMVIVEGKTEEIFINSMVQPYLAPKNIFIRATQITKPGQKGGDVRFARVKRDLAIHLRQRKETYVTIFVDYYGIKHDWPGLDSVREGATPKQIARTINHATKAMAVELFAKENAENRFIPFIAVHEFEALLFSDPALLSSHLEVRLSDINAVLAQCGTPEAINNNPDTAPSKRLDGWSKNGKFPKTTTGIAIAQGIGINKMREECPLFDTWLNTFEMIQEGLNG